MHKSEQEPQSVPENTPVEDGAEAPVEVVEKTPLQRWSDKFVVAREVVALLIKNFDSANDSVADIEMALDDLEDRITEAEDDDQIDISEREVQQRLGQIDRLRRRVKRLAQRAPAQEVPEPDPTTEEVVEPTVEVEADEEKWDAVYPNHPEEFRNLHQLVAANAGFLADSDWDPRTVVLGSGKNVLEELQYSLSEARDLRESMNRGPNGGGESGYRRNKGIGELYVSPAEDLENKLKARIKELEDKQFEEWKKDLEDSTKFPKAVALKTELNRAMPVQPYGTDTPERRLNRLRGLNGNIDRIGEAEAELGAIVFPPGDLGERQKAHIKKEYTDKIVKVENELKGEDEKNRAEVGLQTWEAGVKPLVDVIQEVISLDEYNVKPKSTKPDAKSKAELEALVANLTSEMSVARTAGFFDKNSYTNEKILKRIDEIVGPDGSNGRFSKAREKLQRMIKSTEEELPPRPISEMPYDEFADEMIKLGLDPIRLEYGQGRPPGRAKDLAIAYNKTMDPEGRHPSGREYTPDEIVENISKKYELLLKMLNAKLVDGSGAASTNRAMLFEQLKAYVFSRKDLMIATTYNPIWGELTRDILRNIIESAAKGKVTINGTEEKFDYNMLAGEQGFTHLNDMVSKSYPTPTSPPATEAEVKKVENAKMYAKLLFTVFDMLNIVLQENQLQTKTRAHNNGLQMTDAISLQFPLAAYVHNSERYGGNPKDWRAWFLLYLEEIPESNSGRFGAKGNSHRLHEMQRMLKIHQEAYYDTSSFVGKVKIPGFCRSLFPDTYDLVVLNEGEYLQLPDGTVVDKDGNPTTNKEYVTVFALYETSMKGWEELLKFTFQEIPPNITEHHIMIEAKSGEKSGLLGLWLAKAGMMKVFPGPIGEILAPMLTHYIFRLFQHYVGGADARKTLLAKIIIELEHTRDRGGLENYKAALNEVIDNLKGSGGRGVPQNLQPGSNYRAKQRRKYLDEVWEEEHPALGSVKAKKPPRSFLGMNLNPLFDTQRDEYFDQLHARDGASLPLPARRDGTMIQIDEKSGH